MSVRREGLIARFQVRSRDRLRKIRFMLDQLEAGHGTEELRKELAREIHTLKGDSRVVGFERVAELAHHAEDQVLASSPGGALPDGPACHEVRVALEAAEHALLGASADAPLDAALGAARQRLEQGQATPAAPPSAPSQERWTQVRTSRVDEMTDQVSQLASELLALIHRSAGAVNARGLHEDLTRCRTLLEQVMDSAWSLRLVSVEPALQLLAQHGEHLAGGSGKQVRIAVRGEGVEIERTVLEELSEPLMHLLRNAVDHGIEPPAERGQKPAWGKVAIEARSVGANVVIVLADDGRGVDVEAVRRTAIGRELLAREAAEALDEQEVLELLFTHGFSTRSSVTETSGRGVGLDVVRSRVEALGGKVSVTSQLGLGTRFVLSVPATVTRERCLVVEVGGALYAFPAPQVREVLRTREAAPVEVSGGTSIRFRDRAIPVHSLGAALGYGRAEEETSLVVVEQGTRHYAFGVGQLVGERELIRSPLDPTLRVRAHLAATSTLEDGRVVMVLSTAGLIRRTGSPGTALAPAAPPRGASPGLRVLVVDDSPTVRDLLSEILTEARFTVQEATDGLAAMSLLERGVPDLVLIDLEMPQIDGFELLRRIRARWPRLPVVILSTRGTAEDRRRAVSLGASAYLVKSEFEESNLVSTVRRFAVGGR